LFEQAHRIAFGYGVVPWEFRAGIRSPVLPYVLAALFWVSERVVGGPEGYLLVTRAVLGRDLAFGRGGGLSHGPTDQPDPCVNAIVLIRAFLDDFTPQFTLQECSGKDDDVCIMRRKDDCTPAPDLEVNTMLRRVGE
jgi:hypothetical protein